MPNTLQTRLGRVTTHQYESALKIFQNELTQVQKDTLVACLIKGVSQSAYAKELGVNKSTVNRNLHRALERLHHFTQYL